MTQRHSGIDQANTNDHVAHFLSLHTVATTYGIATMRSIENSEHKPNTNARQRLATSKSSRARGQLAAGFIGHFFSVGGCSMGEAMICIHIF
jgi:hypothetical protein